MSWGLAACSDDSSPSEDSGGSTPLTTEPSNRDTTLPSVDDAVTTTWVLETPSQVVVPPPPAPGSPEAAADSAELIRRHGERTPEAEAEIRYAADRPAVTPWIELTLDLVAQHGKNPPLAARSYALVSVAMHDAVVSASHWKAIYDLAPPG